MFLEIDIAEQAAYQVTKLSLERTKKQSLVKLDKLSAKRVEFVSQYDYYHDRVHDFNAKLRKRETERLAIAPGDDDCFKSL